MAANESDGEILSILEKSGKYQAWQYLLASLPIIFVSMSTVNYVFVAGDINYRCRVPECENGEGVLSPTWWPTTDVDRCSRPLINRTLLALHSTCTNDSFVTEVEKCKEWVYENNDTVVAELNLGCQPWKVNFVGTIHGVGMIVAVIGSGWMCDRFGRKPTLIAFGVGCILGNLKIYAKSYQLYIFLEFLEGAITTGAYTASAVIMSENSSKETRIVAGILFAYAIYSGEALLACIAMYVSYWKNLIYVIYTPPILFLSYTYLLKESPRWLILNGKTQEAKEILKLMIKTNKLKIDTKKIDNVTGDELKRIFDLDKVSRREGYKEMLKSGEIIKRLAAGIVWRLSATYIYYSLVINSVYLPGNKYTTFLLIALTSYPGEMISLYFMNKIGRKKTLLIGLLTCGLTCVASAYIPESQLWTKIALFLLGKLTVSACYTATVVYTIELFPTSVRGSCIGICTLASCAGSMLAPLSPVLTAFSPTLSSFTYMGFAILASGFVLLTPETKNSSLLDTIDQVILSAKKLKSIKTELISSKETVDTEGIDNLNFRTNSVNYASK